ncbi:DUF5662 family protein [Neobacillus kokaensis]|uniref:Uncharacterized protein n=1 Tax=Neobacillus kokaensis TaxID=2759023 RepID=A0ABQ3NAI8_9BACI|nr:DUF5662 family protein [Neobacillus kokaensis]GHH99461.1 hypothetical protein AM1BK_30040 [Neobacillus kokaensis]
MLHAYWRNFLYILNHKVNVLVECWKEGLYIQGIIHDWSKFSLLFIFTAALRLVGL